MERVEFVDLRGERLETPGCVRDALGERRLLGPHLREQVDDLVVRRPEVPHELRVGTHPRIQPSPAKPVSRELPAGCERIEPALLAWGEVDRADDDPPQGCSFCSTVQRGLQLRPAVPSGEPSRPRLEFVDDEAVGCREGDVASFVSTGAVDPTDVGVLRAQESRHEMLVTTRLELAPVDGDGFSDHRHLLSP